MYVVFHTEKKALLHLESVNKFSVLVTKFYTSYTDLIFFPDFFYCRLEDHLLLAARDCDQSAFQWAKDAMKMCSLLN
jgi:hypothetical protein